MLKFHFQSDTTLQYEGDHREPERVILQHNLQRTVITKPSPGVRTALALLQAPGATEADLSACVARIDASSQLPVWYYLFSQLQKSYFIWHTLYHDSVPILTVQTFRGDGQYKQPVPSDKTYRLSRFACCRWEENTVVLESPLASATLVIHYSDMLSTLYRGAFNGQQFSEALPDLPPEVCAQAVSLLDQHMFLTVMDQAGVTEEEQNPVLYTWTFHDLLFHQRSRQSSYNKVIHRSHRYPPHISPPPAIKPRMSEQSIALAKSDIEILINTDMPLTKVLEQRRSTLRYGGQPVTLQAIGELLYRAARVKSIHPHPGGPIYETTRRPYPGGGAVYELEIYLAVNRCDGLAPGIYHYRPLEHELEPVSDYSPQTKFLLRAAQASAAAEQLPQVLMIFTARFQRIAWKYDPIAYALILKNLGVLLQTLFLVAVSMGIAWCPLGTANTDMILSAIPALDGLQEGPVGEAIFGSMPD